ncbi:MAG TPA: HAD-IA family hydrolase [Anaerolineales bacterium]|nr:HAD-IA family hydrolase [Anaerolineales bacterium]
MLKAILFDFDGLILDTETPEYHVWQSIYREYGYELPFQEWEKVIGGYGISTFDAAEHLALLSQGRLDSVSLRARHRLESEAVIAASPILPGVLEVIREARQMNLKIAIVSSSNHAWVDGHAKRLGIFHDFDAIICSDEVGIGRTKPHPDLYLLALRRLHVQANEAIALEDSPNGVTAAKRAGLFVVAVPNPLTARLKFEGADVILPSLSELHLRDFIK